MEKPSEHSMYWKTAHNSSQLEATMMIKLSNFSLQRAGELSMYVCSHTLRPLKFQVWNLPQINQACTNHDMAASGMFAS